MNDSLGGGGDIISPEGVDITDHKDPSVSVYLVYSSGKEVLFANDPFKFLGYRSQGKGDDCTFVIKGQEGKEKNDFLKELFNATQNNTELSEEKKLETLRFVLLSSYESLYKLLENKETDDDQIKKNLENTTTFMKTLIDQYGDKIHDLFKIGLDFTTTNHSVNIMALTMNSFLKADRIKNILDKKLEENDSLLFKGEIEASKIFLDNYIGSDSTTLATAFLFHDIGKANQKDLFGYAGSFDVDKKRLMEKHPSDGVDLAIRLGIIDPFILARIRNHHRRSNNTGYPEPDGKYPVEDIDYFLGLVDSFEAMTSNFRVYGKMLLARDALELLKNDITKDDLYPKHLYNILVVSLGVDLSPTTHDIH